MRRYLPRSISSSLMVLYYSCVGMVTNVKLRQRKSSITTIAMHVDAVFAFAWMSWYAASRSIFLIRMHFEGHSMLMDAIIWIILRRHKQWKHSWRVSLSTRLFMDRPKGPGKDHSWVMRLFVYESTLSLIENCLATPSGTAPASLMWPIESIVRGSANTRSTYLSITLPITARLRSEFDNFWFSIRIIASRSDFLVASSIGDRWYRDHFGLCSLFFPCLRGDLIT